MRELMSLMAKEGLQISKGRLARILSNSFYIGKIKNVKGNYKPLIDEKTFDTVQGMLRKRLN